MINNWPGGIKNKLIFITEKNVLIKSQCFFNNEKNVVRHFITKLSILKITETLFHREGAD